MTKTDKEGEFRLSFFPFSMTPPPVVLLNAFTELKIVLQVSEIVYYFGEEKKITYGSPLPSVGEGE